MFRRILDYFRKEIQLTKEYYQEPESVEIILDSSDEKTINTPDIPPNISIPKPISNEDYQRRRQAQANQAEQQYDFSTAEGISAIPDSRRLIQAAGRDPDIIEYCLKQKCGEYESSGKTELAVLCLRKLNQIRMTYRNGYRKDDYYRLVRLLAYGGKIEEAKEEKADIDAFFRDSAMDRSIISERIKHVLDWAKECNTDLVLMEPHGCSCPECAKFQGRVFSLSGRTKQFPTIPKEFFTYGGIHEGCSHTFYPYLQGDPMLDYTLTFQTNVAPQYRKNIIAFSNRPFIDDRLPEDIKKAQEYADKCTVAYEQQLYYWEHMIEIEAQRGIDKRDYAWLQENLPDICPKSYSGYKRMKNGNTKNYQKLVARAKELGRIIT